MPVIEKCVAQISFNTLSSLPVLLGKLCGATTRERRRGRCPSRIGQGFDGKQRCRWTISAR